MGYRVRLGKISKDTDLRNKSEEYWEGRADAPYHPTEHTQLYEIGKYVHYGEETIPYYRDVDIYKNHECEFHIMTKGQLKAVIEDYHKMTFEYFSGLVKDGSHNCLAHCENMLREWRPNPMDVKPYWLDEEGTDGEIVSSWKMQYAIFNLVYIYRTFDWENDYLIYSGW